MTNEIETYKNNLMSEIHLLAEQNGNMPREEFITQITDVKAGFNLTHLAG